MRVFGEVRDSEGSGDLPEGHVARGKVYVQYETKEEVKVARRAFDALWSRMFDNRLLGIGFYSQQQWELMKEELKG